MLYGRGRYRECAEALATRLQQLPAKDLQLLASCAYLTGDYPDALRAAAKLASNPITAAQGLYWETKSAQKLATQSLARASAADPGSPKLHVLLGDIYRQQKAFPDAEQLQDARHDDLPDAHLLPEVGENGVLHEVAHLVGNAGDGGDGLGTVLDDEARCRADGILDGDGPVGDEGLLAIVLAHFPAQPGKEIVDLVTECLIEDERSACHLGNRLACQIVERRADASGGENEVCPAQGVSQCRLDPLKVVAHGGFEMYVCPDRRELLGHVGRVGVHDLAQQQLGSDGDDLCFHVHDLSWGDPDSVQRLAIRHTDWKLGATPIVHNRARRRRISAARRRPSDMRRTPWPRPGLHSSS